MELGREDPDFFARFQLRTPEAALAAGYALLLPPYVIHGMSFCKT